MLSRPTARHTAHRIAFAMMLALLALTAIACRGDKNKDGEQASATGDPPVFSATIFPSVTSGEESPTPTVAEAPTPSPFPMPKDDTNIVRLMIPSAKVNAPLQVKGVNARNEMENPDGKDNVAWYNFTGRPGFGSNAVFSGHVDWFTGEQAVFWFLKDLKQGDEIVVKMSDGMELKYHVTATDTYSSASAPVGEIIGPTTKDVVTLITCEGSFNRNSQDYDKRRVVRAERVA